MTDEVGRNSLRQVWLNLCDCDICCVAREHLQVGFVHCRYYRPASEIGDSYDDSVNGFVRPKSGTAEQLSAGTQARVSTSRRPSRPTLR